MTANAPHNSPHNPPHNPSGTPAEAPASVHHLEQQRRANRDAVAALGLAPYGRRVDGLISLAAAKARHSDAADKAVADAGKTPPAGFVDPRPVVSIAGRVVLLRDNGKLLWLQVRDDTATLQLAVSQKDVDEASFKFAKLIDLGDVITATGRVMKTKTGEITVWASAIAPASKCLVPPPEKHAGLHDVELRYRQRYVDMWAEPETATVFRTRSLIVSKLRELLNARGYLEVETPMLQVLAGGAAARPFITHMNALDLPLYMRIAPELYLKRLLVGGMPRVYEINRNFRNEGLDKQHNPEFTMLEAYHAFGDVETVMELTESLIREAARAVTGSQAGDERSPRSESPDGSRSREHTDPSGDSSQSLLIPGLPPAHGPLILPFGDLHIDYGSPFRRVAYGDLFKAALGFDMFDRARVKSEAGARHIKSEGVDHWVLVNHLFEAFAEKTVDPAKPTFITDYPAAISPLTRPKPTNPDLADRADLFIGGMEIAPHYTELNDPDVQAAKFREQLATGDAEKNAEENTFRTFDADFINALKVGMPPAGGMGLGIDRLVMLLTNQRTIRDVVLFPLMRPV